MNIELKDRSFGDTLGASLGLVFNNFLIMLKYILIFSGISLVLMGAVGGLLYLTGLFDSFFDADLWSRLSYDPESLFTSIDSMSTLLKIYGGILLIAIPASLVMYIILPVFLINTFQKAYTGQTEDRSFSELLKFSFSRFWPYFLSGILVALGVYGGVLLLIVPGIIFSLAWTVVGPVIVAEDVGPIEAMRRSWRLTEGNRWEIFGLVIVMYLIIIAASLVVGVFVGILSYALSAINQTVSTIITSIIQSALYLVIYPLYYGLYVVIYYNLRIRKEGFSVEHLARDFHNEPQADF